MKYMDRLAEVNEGNQCVAAVAEVFKNNAHRITPSACVDVELTYIETQWYRFKRQFADPATE